METYKLGNLLMEMQEKYVEQPAFVFSEDGNHTTSVMYSDFLKDLKRGVAKGKKLKEQRIAILGYNSYEWIVTAFSLLLAGKSLILLDANANDQDLLSLIEYADVDCVMMSDELEEEMGFLRERFQIGYFFDIKKQGEENFLEDLPVRNSDFLCFTSGTSKNSKGVVVTAEVFVKHILLAENVLPGNRGDRFFLPLPLHHMYALTMIFHIMKKGATVCMGKSPRYLKQGAKLFQPQIAMLVPSMIEFLFKEPGIMPGLRAVIIGGSRCRKELADMVRASGAYIINIYGSSETAGFISCSQAYGDERWVKPYGPIQFKLSDRGELGVILPFCMEGYYNRPEDTKQVLDGNCFWTGDAAALDEEGRAMILGRIRDTIVTENGEKIHAEDIDSMLTSKGLTEDAAVVYFPEYGISAVVVTDSEEGRQRMQKEIEVYNRNCRPGHRITDVWYRKKRLPRTSTGKLKRYELEAEYRSWREKRASEGK